MYRWVFTICYRPILSHLALPLYSNLTLLLFNCIIEAYFIIDAIVIHIYKKFVIEYIYCILDLFLWGKLIYGSLYDCLGNKMAEYNIEEIRNYMNLELPRSGNIILLTFAFFVATQTQIWYFWWRASLNNWANIYYC